VEWPQIIERIKGGEGRHIEFKRGLGDLSAIGRAICAFANGEGGVLILGVENSGEVIGVREDTERVQERLT
jgi:predicted HTH transcriptional regulator